MRKNDQKFLEKLFLHRGNAPAHTELSLKQFLADKHVTVQDFTFVRFWYNIFLFRKRKSVLKERSFESLDAVKKKTDVLKQLAESDVLHGFDQWKTKTVSVCKCQWGLY